jgi:UDP-N-acetylglucosamine--N-acetylmuramyl-(pentapeptide) pyrophosphoryl-undecaprenol N-acetylglucosamine transferase
MKLLIAGGGTGGHLFPALAVARTLKKEHPEASVLFVGTRHGIEAKLMPGSEFPIEFITTRGMRGTGPLNNILGLLELPLGFLQSLKIIFKFKPDFVLGVGGYASGPTLAAAVVAGIPTAIQEQNSVMGTTNRILARFVDKIFTSWEETAPEPPAAKTVFTGNPIREDLLDTAPESAHGDERRLLVFGGSRGAKSINEAIANNLETLAPYSDKLKIIHQAGEGAAPEIREKYEQAGFSAEVREFITDMGAVYHWADLVVCRGGASSLAEIAALGKPAIVIPYPYAIGDHQAKNARVLEKAGAIKVIDDSQLKNGRLNREIGAVLDNPDQLQAMAANCREAGRPDAARAIVLEILKTAGR